ncbi:MAG TPA: Crp/Fnr family transcriptional regulator [Candidatus Saccharimonadales bacterium]|nr:Crp/Fnr family transcriptional regulator [Candidatus Saccharimonadales bacterium]
MLTTHSETNALVNLFHKGTRLRYAKGEYIIRPGGTPPGVFFISEGLVKAFDITKYGEENLLIIRKPGELLCLTWAITGEERDIIYAALAPTTLLQISREDFLKEIHENKNIALPLVDMLADLYREHSKRILTLEYRTVRERLVAFLLNAAERFGEKTHQGTLINAPLRHQDIASSISATRETTGRELSTLERMGLLESKQSIILLKNLPKLQNYLE